MFAERKARVGENTLFRWEAPEPVEAAPTFTVRLPSGSVAIAMTSVHASQAVTGVSTDRRVFTAPGLTVAGARGAQGDWGKAWLVTDEDGVIPIKVVRVEADALRVAEPLPRGIAGNGTVYWATWYATLGAVTGSAVRSVPWDVVYTAQDGLDLPTSPKRDEGLLHIVRQPFNTGLTTQQLINDFPELGATVNRGMQGYRSAIDLSLAQLVAHVRAILQERDLYEDDAHGPTLRHAHAYLAAAVILDRVDPEQADRLREIAKDDIDVALRSIWVDGDGDGEVDDDEAGVQLTGGRAADVGGTFYASSLTYSSKFRVNSLTPDR